MIGGTLMFVCMAYCVQYYAGQVASAQPRDILDTIEFVLNSLALLACFGMMFVAGLMILFRVGP